MQARRQPGPHHPGAGRKEHDADTITILCRCLQVTPSGYYAWRRRPESQRTRDDRRLTVLVRASFDASRQRYGSPRIHEDLREQHEADQPEARHPADAGRRPAGAGAEAVQDHDDERARPAGGGQSARSPVRAAAPNQRWVGDTTEFVIGGSGKLYLAAVLDLFSRFIVGWALSAVNDRHLTIKALEMALKRRGPETGLLHHSDQGCTYASEDYQALLEARGIVCSMSRRGNCYDNAVMESFFSTVKSELGEHFESHGVAKMEVFDYIEVFYNQRRRHSTLGQISPAAFERQDAPITDQRLYSRWAALVWERTLCSRPRTFPARARRSPAAPTTRKRLAGNYGLEESGA